MTSKFLTRGLLIAGVALVSCNENALELGFELGSYDPANGMTCMQMIIMLPLVV